MCVLNRSQGWFFKDPPLPFHLHSAKSTAWHLAGFHNDLFLYCRPCKNWSDHGDRPPCIKIDPPYWKALSWSIFSQISGPNWDSINICWVSLSWDKEGWMSLTPRDHRAWFPKQSKKEALGNEYEGPWDVITESFLRLGQAWCSLCQVWRFGPCVNAQHRQWGCLFRLRLPPEVSHRN